MAELRQTSFRAGEWAPTVQERSDLPAYPHALRRCRGFIVTPHGAAVNRPGLEFLGEVKDSSRKVRLRKFVFSTSQTFVLELGHQYLRFWKDGAQVLQAGVPYELATPYVEADLKALKFAQSGDVISIAHKGYAPMELRRYSNTSWVLQYINFSLPSAADQLSGAGDMTWPSIRYDAKLAITQKASRYEWAVSRVLKETSTGRVVETVPFYFGGATPANVHVPIPSIAAYNPATLYGPSNPYASDGTRTWVTTHAVDAVAGPLAVGVDWTLATVGRELGTLPSPAPGTDFPAWGVMFTLAEHQPLLAWVFAAEPVGWTQVGWRLYQGQGQVMGLIFDKETTQLINTFRVDGTLGPDFNTSPPTGQNPFLTDYPGAVAHFEQRRVWGATALQPADLMASRLADFYDHSPRRVVLDRDPFRFTLASLRFEQIYWFLPLRALLAGSSNGVWVVSGAGGVNDTITALSIRARLQTYHGVSQLDPLVVGNSALALSPLGNLVQELKFDVNTDGYQGATLSLLASHLLDGHSVEGWDYARTPHGVAWSAREDGTLLGMTYVPDLEVVAWHWHDTLGAFEDVCAVEEATEDRVYAIVRRTIGGATKRYVERFATRRVTDARLGVFLDSALQYDGRNTDPMFAQVASPTGNYEPGAEVGLYCGLIPYSIFTPASVGQVVVFQPDSPQPTRVEITAYHDPYYVSGRVLDFAVPVELQDVHTSDFALAVAEVSGLGHLEGESVSAVADGNLVEDLVVTGGKVTLPSPATIIRVGLPYVSELETLDAALEGAKGKQKIVSKIRVSVEAARGLEAGRDLAHVTAWKQRKVSDAWGPVPLFTGEVELLPSGEWAKGGRVAVRQRFPFPVTVLGIAREIDVGG